MTKLILRKADDMHIHLRQGEILEHILEQTVKQSARALVMPNTVPAVHTADDIKKYRQNIEDALKRISARLGKNHHFQPLMTFKVMPDMSAAMIKELKEAGATAGKLYPAGVTTNSEQGISDFTALYPVYEALDKEGLVLCVHGEEPSAFCIDRVETFLPMLKQIAKDFPRLRIVLEHLTTAKAVKLVEELPKNVAATLTVHHLITTLDNVIGGYLKPHLFCKPLPQRGSDREALIQAATSGNPKFFLGSDSAPHLKEKKECDCGAPGVYTGPVILPVLAQIFQSHNKLDKLESFTSKHGAEFYNLPLNEEKVVLAQEQWIVPININGVVPFMAGEKLSWKLVEG